MSISKGFWTGTWIVQIFTHARAIFKVKEPSWSKICRFHNICGHTSLAAYQNVHSFWREIGFWTGACNVHMLIHARTIFKLDCAKFGVFAIFENKLDALLTKNVTHFELKLQEADAFELELPSFTFLLFLQSRLKKVISSFSYNWKTNWNWLDLGMIASVRRYSGSFDTKIKILQSMHLGIRQNVRIFRINFAFSNIFLILIQITDSLLSIV